MSNGATQGRRFDGRAIVVTGAASGFGRAIAVRAASEGASVIVADVDEAGAKETVALIDNTGGTAELIVGDIATAAGAEAAVGLAVRAFGTIDVLVNNAGVAPPEPVDSWNAPEESWDRVLRINLKSVYLCSRVAIPTMLEKGKGSIVNIASIAATRAVSCASYGAAKAGILGYTHQVASELAPRGVRVNCVSPGFMRTPMATGERTGLTPEQQDERMAKMGMQAPIARPGTVDDIASAVLYLASDEAVYITGQEVVVDGGYLAGR